MKFNRIATLVLLLSIPVTMRSSDAPSKQRSVYDFSLVAMDGKDVPLSQYTGKVLLIVNIASQSIFATQVAALKELQSAYADQGLVIVGLPSSDFGSQELADNAAIKQYYQEKEHANFPVFAKVSVRGKDTIPLVRYLTDPKLGLAGGDIHWNFTKFVIDREGHPVMRLEAASDPSDPDFKVKLEQVLNGTYKKENAPKEKATAGGNDDDEED